MHIRMKLYRGAFLDLSRADLPGTIRLSSDWAPVDNPVWQAALTEPAMRKQCAELRIETSDGELS